MTVGHHSRQYGCPFSGLFGTSAAVLWACAGAPGAFAAIAIDAQPSSNISCSAQTCVPTAADAVLNVTTATNMLAAGNLTVTTSGAAGVEAGDIVVGAGLKWHAPTALSLIATHSIAIQREVVITGHGMLSMTDNTGGIGGTLSFTHLGRVVFGTPPAQLAINGIAYTLVRSIRQLAIDVAANPGGSYALGNDYDASAGPPYTLSPVSAEFTGNFEGLGNTISGLRIDNQSGRRVYIGIFSTTGLNASIADLRIREASITVAKDHTGYVGLLVGFGGGTLRGNDVSGKVDAQHAFAGGLAGNFGGSTSDCHGNVDVTGSVAGGLFGYMSGHIFGSSSQGRISASKRRNSANEAGGLIGRLQGNMDQSFATGNVRGGHGAQIGGLVGYSVGGSITNSYATGPLQGTADEIGTSAGAGGFIGDNGSNISTSYSTGALLSGGLDVFYGGFGGSESGANYANAYWDTTTTGTTDGLYGGNQSGLTGVTTAQLTAHLPSGFDPAIWGQSAAINKGYPYLLENPPR